MAITADARREIQQALTTDSINHSMEIHGTILTDTLPQVLSEEVPTLADQIANSLGELAAAVDSGAPTEDLGVAVETLAVTLEHQFYPKTAAVVRTIGRDSLLPARGSH